MGATTTKEPVRKIYPICDPFSVL